MERCISLRPGADDRLRLTGAAADHWTILVANLCRRQAADDAWRSGAREWTAVATVADGLTPFRPVPGLVAADGLRWRQ
jgi:hypothetical protein